jgi:D-alanine transaminase
VETLPTLAYSLQILAIGAADTPVGPTIACIPKPAATYAPQLFAAGAGAITFAGSRFLPQSKAMNTLFNHLARTAAQRQGVLEAILTHDGYLLEGARSNLFVVHAETRQLLTPAKDQVLAGVTREIVMRLMQATAYPVCEADIPLETPIAEMFITSTSMHVMPITQFEGWPIGDGRVGPVSQLAHDRFEAYYRRYFD